MMERTASWDKIGVDVIGSKKVQDALNKAGSGLHGRYGRCYLYTPWKTNSYGPQ